MERPLLDKGRTAQDMANYFDMKTHYAKEHAVELLKKIRKEEAESR